MLSVVIPTRDRARNLERTLERLLSQREPPGGFEVVVADNGSSDATPLVVEAAAEAFGGRLTGLIERKPGPAAARNAGVRAATGEVILFLGDDTAPAQDDLLVGHGDLHAREASPHFAILGRVAWAPGTTVTPFMHWLEDGTQFAYRRLSAGEVSATGYLYTAHVSLARRLFDQVGGFDERFTSAGLEDVELGVRLAEAGIRLHYHPQLLVHHDHPTDPRAYARRAREVGRAAALYSRLHPERPNPSFRPLPAGRSVMTAAGLPALRLLARAPLPYVISRRVWRELLKGEVDWGYRHGPRESSGPGDDQLVVPEDAGLVD